MSYVIWAGWILFYVLAYTVIAALCYRVLHIALLRAYGEGAGGTEQEYRILLSQAKGSSMIWPLSLGWLIVATVFEWIVIAPIRFVWTKITGTEGTK